MVLSDFCEKIKISRRRWPGYCGIAQSLHKIWYAIINESYILVHGYSRLLLLLPHDCDGVSPEAEHNLNPVTILARSQHNVGVLISAVND